MRGASLDRRQELICSGIEDEVQETESFGEVVAVIVGMNLLFSVDSILTVVGMTDVFAVMVGSVVISVALMLIFANPLARFLHASRPGLELPFVRNHSPAYQADAWEKLLERAAGGSL